MNLYFSGNIQIKITKNYFHNDYHMVGNLTINSITPNRFNFASSTENLGLNQQIIINYSTNFTVFKLPDNSPYKDLDLYQYYYSNLTVTINWGKNSKGKLISVVSQNQNGTITLPIPNSFIGDFNDIKNIPTITFILGTEAQWGKDRYGHGYREWKATLTHKVDFGDGDIAKKGRTVRVIDEGPEHVLVECDFGTPGEEWTGEAWIPKSYIGNTPTPNKKGYNYPPPPPEPADGNCTCSDECDEDTCGGDEYCEYDEGCDDEGCDDEGCDDDGEEIEYIWATRVYYTGHYTGVDGETIFVSSGGSVLVDSNGSYEGLFEDGSPVYGSADSKGVWTLWM